MRQILMNMGGVVVARMPRPTVQRGTVLIRVRYSLVSVGTEVAPLRPASVSAPDVTRDRTRTRARAIGQALLPRQPARPAQGGTADVADGGAPAVARCARRRCRWRDAIGGAGRVRSERAGLGDRLLGRRRSRGGRRRRHRSGGRRSGRGRRCRAGGHAEYVNVPRNLVCRVPAGCDLKHAASATIGAIALQGVRRAAPQLGERVCVVGLGLIGQITVQLLKAAGCRVIGLDLDAARVERALGTRSPRRRQRRRRHEGARPRSDRRPRRGSHADDRRDQVERASSTSRWS